LNLDLSPQESDTLASVLEDAVSDLRMEVANTDAMDVREELKAREAFLKRVIGQLRGGTSSAASVSGVSGSSSAKR